MGQEHTTNITEVDGYKFLLINAKVWLVHCALTVFTNIF